MKNEIELLPLSYSKLSKYRDCPHRAKHEPFKSIEAGIAGNLVHDAAKVLHLQDEPTARKFLADKIVVSGLPRKAATDCLDMFDDLAKSPRYNVDKSEIITVESDDGETEMYGKKYFLVPLPIVVSDSAGQKKRIALRGAMDIVLKQKNAGPGIFIRDYKTGYADADELQADLYALAAFFKYGKPSPIMVQFAYLRKGFASSPAVYYEQHLSSVLEYVAILTNAYAKETEWKPRFNKCCYHCSLQFSCDEYLDKISKIPEKKEIQEDNWDAIQAWKTHLSALAKVSKSFLDDISEKEKEYLRRNGPQLAGSGTKEVTLCEEVSSYEYPAQLISDMLKTYGLDPVPVAKFSSAGIDALIKQGLTLGTINPQAAKEIDDKVQALRSVAAYKHVVRMKTVKKK